MIDHQKQWVYPLNCVTLWPLPGAGSGPAGTRPHAGGTVEATFQKRPPFSPLHS